MLPQGRQSSELSGEAEDVGILPRKDVKRLKGCVCHRNLENWFNTSCSVRVLLILYPCWAERRQVVCPQPPDYHTRNSIIVGLPAISSCASLYTGTATRILAVLEALQQWNLQSLLCRKAIQAI